MRQSALTKVMGIEEGQSGSSGVKLGPVRSCLVKLGQVGSSRVSRVKRRQGQAQEFIWVQAGFGGVE